MSVTRHVAIVGGGLAGLVAATEAAAQGASVTLFERDATPGGATIDSAGWIWRYVDHATARACAPAGDPSVQRAIVDDLDSALGWLEAHGVELVARGTGRAHTTGVRIDPRQTITCLWGALVQRWSADIRTGTTIVGARRTGSVIELSSAGPAPAGSFDGVVFAGGGYAADLDRIADDSGVTANARRSWLLRAPRAGDGSSMDAAIQLGARRAATSGESLVRLVPDVPGPLTGVQLVRGGELQVPGHRIVAADGTPVPAESHDWSGAIVAWALARLHGRGRIELSAEALATRVHAGGTVADAVAAAIDDGAAVGRLGDGGLWLAVRAGITTTRCTLDVDAHGALRHGPPSTWAVGADAACSGRGGTASGLAQALVLGRRAGRAATAG